MLKSYKQIFSETNSSGNDVWIVSERVVNGTSNVGESYIYHKNKELSKTFTMGDALSSDLCDIVSFLLNLDEQVEGYYYGNTSSWRYNDSTGNAYLVKYNEDGTVRLVYKGNFVNGNALYEDDKKLIDVSDAKDIVSNYNFKVSLK